MELFKLNGLILFFSFISCKNIESKSKVFLTFYKYKIGSPEIIDTLKLNQINSDVQYDFDHSKYKFSIFENDSTLVIHNLNSFILKKNWFLDSINIYFNTNLRVTPFFLSKIMPLGRRSYNIKNKNLIVYKYFTYENHESDGYSLFYLENFGFLIILDSPYYYTLKFENKNPFDGFYSLIDSIKEDRYFGELSPVNSLQIMNN